MSCDLTVCASRLRACASNGLHAVVFNRHHEPFALGVLLVVPVLCTHKVALGMSRKTLFRLDAPVRGCRGDVELVHVVRSSLALQWLLRLTCTNRALGCGARCRDGHALVPSMFQSLRMTVAAVPAELPPAVVWGGNAGSASRVMDGCYLVDPASSHMLVSKIKPCMCKYELIQTVKLRMAH